MKMVNANNNESALNIPRVETAREWALRELDKMRIARNMKNYGVPEISQSEISRLARMGSNNRTIHGHEHSTYWGQP